MLPRGGGTSQCGQTVGAAVVIDVSKHLREVVALDVAARRVRVQPGMVLDHLNQALKPHGLFFPVDPVDRQPRHAGRDGGEQQLGQPLHRLRQHGAQRARGGGGARRRHPGPLRPRDGARCPRRWPSACSSVARREAPEISARFPKVLRRVGGYNLDQLLEPEPNLARLLVGSEGTLAFFTELELLLQPLPKHRVLGVCHFPTLRRGDGIDRGHRPARPGRGGAGGPDHPRAVAGDAGVRADPRPLRPRPARTPCSWWSSPATTRRRCATQLADLDRTMERLGLRRRQRARWWTPGEQAKLWTVRSAGLNIVSSIRGDAKPVSVIEDCAVPLKHLAPYTARLTRLFEKHGTRGTWYAHASVGCLHVRPVLNMKSDLDVRKLRAIAEEAFAIVREYGGQPLRRARRRAGAQRVPRRDVRPAAGPGLRGGEGRLRSPRASTTRERSSARRAWTTGRCSATAPAYAPLPLQTGLDWSAEGGFAAATEMCNNNGACRKRDPGVMCPSFMVTQDEQHGVRGRANALRLALTGQLGAGRAALRRRWRRRCRSASRCKGCRRECPTGVDMAKMKIEVALPAPAAARASRSRTGWWPGSPASLPGRSASASCSTSATAGRGWRGSPSGGAASAPAAPSPRWSAQPFRFERERRAELPADAPEVVLLVDTFTAWFEPEVARSGLRVLERAGYRVHLPSTGQRPLCCGRTFLSAGLVDEARAEMEETLRTLRPFLDRGLSNRGARAVLPPDAPRRAPLGAPRSGGAAAGGGVDALRGMGAPRAGGRAASSSRFPATVSAGPCSTATVTRRPSD